MLRPTTIYIIGDLVWCDQQQKLINLSNVKDAHASESTLGTTHILV